MIADLKDREPNTVTLFVIINFSHHEHLHLLKDHVVTFAEKDCNEGEVSAQWSNWRKISQEIGYQRENAKKN